MKELSPGIKPKTVVLTPDIQPTVDEEYCVCPDAHRELEQTATALSPNPLARYIAMGEILGPPKCRKSIPGPYRKG